MAEPLLYTALQRIQANLAAIVADGGTTYHFTPTAVYIVSTWVDPRLWDMAVGQDDGSAKVVYAVRRGDRSHARRHTGDLTTGAYNAALLEFDILVTQYLNPSSPTDTPDATLTLDRMVRDVIRKLALEDPGLGDLQADDVEPSDDAVIDDAPAGWIAAQVTFRTSYEYPSSAP